MRILKIFSGLMLIFAGIWCFANQGVTFNALAFVLGIVMIIVGVIGALTFLYMKNRPEGLGWLFSESFITIILGIVVLSGLLVTDTTISVFFGVWLLCSSSSRMVGALTMLRHKSPAWSWTLGFGFLGLITGIYSFVNTTLAFMNVGMLVSLFFFIYGINVFATGIALPHVERKKKKKKKKAETEPQQIQQIEQFEQIDQLIEFEESERIVQFVEFEEAQQVEQTAEFEETQQVEQTVEFEEAQQVEQEQGEDALEEKNEKL